MTAADQPQFLRDLSRLLENPAIAQVFDRMEADALHCLETARPEDLPAAHANWTVIRTLKRRCWGLAQHAPQREES